MQKGLDIATDTAMDIAQNVSHGEKITLASVAGSPAFNIITAGNGNGSAKSAGNAIADSTEDGVRREVKDSLVDSVSRGGLNSNTGQVYSNKGYNLRLGERMLEGYVKQNANPEISLHTDSAGFNNVSGRTGGDFKRFGSRSHGGVSPHVHQPKRNVSPNGDIYGTVNTKTSKGGVTSPTAKDVKQLYEYLANGKYHDWGD